MNKVLTAAAIALFLCAPVASAYVQRVRVGPESDEATSDAPAKREKKPNSGAESKQVKNDKSSEAKRDAKGDGKNAARPEDKDAGKKTVALSANTPAPVNAAPPVSTSDAPSKSNSDTVVPLLAPSKNEATKAGASNAPPANASNNSHSNAVASPDKSNATTKPSDPAPSTNKTSAATLNATPSNTASTGAASPAVTSPANAAPSPLTSVPPVTYSPAPVPALTAIYRIGIGDVLDIRLLNQTNSRESTLYTVMAGGLLEYPLAGEPLVVTGMTTEELSARLSLSLKRRAVYDKPQLVVSVRDYASHTVLVSGMVSDPGAKLLRREAVPLYVVIAEAQPHADAGRAVVISHATGQTETVDLADSASLNILVHAGDVVNVQARPKEFLYMGGEIAMPGQKDFHAGMTLTQAVLASGGVTRVAGPKIKVSRQGADGRLVSTEYNLSEIESGAVPDPRLQPGDRVEVSARKR